MKFEGSSISCGVDQGYDLSDNPLDDAFQMAEYIYQDMDDEVGSGAHAACAFVMFSDVIPRRKKNVKSSKAGAALAKFLKKLDVGVVTETATKRNPNSGNPIRVWIFAPNHTKFRKWMKDEEERRRRPVLAPARGRGRTGPKTTPAPRRRDNADDFITRNYYGY